MLFHINSVQIKSPDWRVLELTGLDDAHYENVSVNRTNQKGEPQWPDMDAFEEGKSINGNVWKSPSEKLFLFPLREKTSGGAPKTANIAKAQAVKAENIKEAQENRAQGVFVSATMRDATQIALASLKDQPFPTDADFDREFEKWRTWYMKKWHKTEDEADQAF